MLKILLLYNVWSINADNYLPLDLGFEQSQEMNPIQVESTFGGQISVHQAKSVWTAMLDLWLWLPTNTHSSYKLSSSAPSMFVNIDKKKYQTVIKFFNDKYYATIEC